MSNNLGNGMDNNFYDELKKFLNNIENPFRPEGDIFTVKILTSQNGCHKNDASEINHNNFSLVYIWISLIILKFI